MMLWRRTRRAPKHGFVAESEMQLVGFVVVVVVVVGVVGGGDGNAAHTNPQFRE